MVNNMHENIKDAEKCALFAVNAKQEDLDELALLCESAGLTPVGRICANRESPHPNSYFGKGKLEELGLYAKAVGATTLICDDELSARQLKHISKTLNLNVLDRTLVILDIFAQRANMPEGKAQVELAQLSYSLSRLSGIGVALSRQGGGRGLGVGARGPGEKKLETDRRHIERRIEKLKADLRENYSHRKLLRKNRRDPVIALVGYTNAGKSTLMNALTKADVYVCDQLFATLETTARRLELPTGTRAILTDSVGFINKLPHHLIRAFHATLEELRYASVLIHVIDCSNPNYLEQAQTVENVLKSLELLNIPLITAFNKTDLLKKSELSFNRDGSAFISAKTGLGLEDLARLCEEKIAQKPTFFIAPYSDGGAISEICKDKILNLRYTETGIEAETYASPENIGKYAKYITNV